MAAWSTLPYANSVKIITATTATAGANFVAFADTPCTTLDLVNSTAATVEYRRDGSGPAIQVAPGASRLVIGISNANQIGVRRTDQSATQVVVTAEAFVNG